MYGMCVRQKSTVLEDMLGDASTKCIWVGGPATNWLTDTVSEGKGWVDEDYTVIWTVQDFQCGQSCYILEIQRWDNNCSQRQTLTFYTCVFKVFALRLDHFFRWTCVQVTFASGTFDVTQQYPSGALTVSAFVDGLSFVAEVQLAANDARVCVIPTVVTYSTPDTPIWHLDPSFVLRWSTHQTYGF